MTDRVEGAYVQFTKDIRVDDVEPILNAIRMVKGVSEVETEHHVSTPATWAARHRVKDELYETLTFVLQGLIHNKVFFVSNKDQVQLALAKLQTMLRDL